MRGDKQGVDVSVPCLLQKTAGDSQDCEFHGGLWFSVCGAGISYSTQVKPPSTLMFQPLT